MTDTVPDLYYDPFDVDIDANPYEIWRRMRDESPVYRNEEYDFYALTRFDDVEAAHLDPKTFSSAHGTVLEIMSANRIPVAQMIFMDPPDHTRLRGLVSRAFTPRRVSALEDRIRELCADFLDAQAGRGGFDYVQDFGARLPAMVIASLLGVPIEDQEWARGQIDTVFHIEPGVGMINDISFNAQIELTNYLTAQLEERARSPRDDMLTDLVNAEITDDDGTVRRLEVYESALFANLLINAGTETVARLLGWSAVLLARHPEQRAELAADFSLIPNAIEELLRYEAPSPVQGRWTTAPVDPPRFHHSEGFEGVAPHRGRRTRRAQVPRCRSLRHPSRVHPARVVRLRRSLLHRRGSGSTRRSSGSGGDLQALSGLGRR